MKRQIICLQNCPKSCTRIDFEHDEGNVDFMLRNRKELPRFGVLKGLHFSVSDCLAQCTAQGLLDFNRYNDIKASHGSRQSLFVKANAYNKNTFFKASHEENLEGELYRQVYLTELDPQFTEKDLDLSTGSSRVDRLRRLYSTSANYDPIADEMNYNTRNELVIGFFEQLLNSFVDSVKRVRLAYLAPQFSIQPHIDYDPSYITRLHFPIITSTDCFVHTYREKNWQRIHWPADGRVYFLNAGLKHFASNHSNTARLHLIIDVSGQNCLNNLVEISGENYVE